MKNIISLLLLIISLPLITFAKPTSIEYLNEAVYVAEVKSFTNNGFLNCNFQCFLDFNYTDFEVAPTLYFQVGTIDDPTAFKNVTLDAVFVEAMTIEKVFQKESYKLKLDFGKIAVQKDFIARLVLEHNGEKTIIVLKPTNFRNQITIMDAEKDAEEKGLCKAEQFLRKINFDRLYEEYSYIED